MCIRDRVFDVAWSDDRKLVDGKLAPVGNTVDHRSGTYVNDIGAVQLSTLWRDPEFDPDNSAFYYVRVLEIPTPRWTTYDAIRTGEELPNNVPSSIQERAWSSPIWYSSN